jgi:hypothetical protein
MMNYDFGLSAAAAGYLVNDQLQISISDRREQQRQGTLLMTNYECRFRIVGSSSGWVLMLNHYRVVGLVRFVPFKKGFTNL